MGEVVALAKDALVAKRKAHPSRKIRPAPFVPARFGRTKVAHRDRDGLELSRHRPDHSECFHQLINMFSLCTLCHTEEKWRRARKHLLARAAEDKAIAARITESAERVRALKKRYLGSWPRPWSRQQDWRDVLGSTLHREELAALSHAADVGVDPTEA